MQVIISMLRGVNVLGRNKIKMDALRAHYGSLGLRDAQTYIQSGNVVFRTERRHLTRLRSEIETGIERRFGFRPSVVVRTADEMRAVVARNPFAARQNVDPSKLLVNFLAGDPGAEARQKLLEIKCEPEELRIDGRELYIYFPNGVGQSKLSFTLIERTLKTPGTGRNWNTVRKLLEMAERLEVLA